MFEGVEGLVTQLSGIARGMSSSRDASSVLRGLRAIGAAAVLPSSSRLMIDTLHALALVQGDNGDLVSAHFVKSGVARLAVSRLQEVDILDLSDPDDFLSVAVLNAIRDAYVASEASVQFDSSDAFSAVPGTCCAAGEHMAVLCVGDPGRGKGNECSLRVVHSACREVVAYHLLQPRRWSQQGYVHLDCAVFESSRVDALALSSDGSYLCVAMDPEGDAGVASSSTLVVVFDWSSWTAVCSFIAPVRSVRRITWCVSDCLLCLWQSTDSSDGSSRQEAVISDEVPVAYFLHWPLNVGSCSALETCHSPCRASPCRARCPPGDSTSRYADRPLGHRQGADATLSSSLSCCMEPAASPTVHCTSAEPTSSSYADEVCCTCREEEEEQSDAAQPNSSAGRALLAYVPEVVWLNLDKGSATKRSDFDQNENADFAAFCTELFLMEQQGDWTAALIDVCGPTELLGSNDVALAAADSFSGGVFRTAAHYGLALCWSRDTSEVICPLAYQLASRYPREYTTVLLRELHRRGLEETERCLQAGSRHRAAGLAARRCSEWRRVIFSDPLSANDLIATRIGELCGLLCEKDKENVPPKAEFRISSEEDEYTEACRQELHRLLSLRRQVVLVSLDEFIGTETWSSNGDSGELEEIFNGHSHAYFPAANALSALDLYHLYVEAPIRAIATRRSDLLCRSGSRHADPDSAGLKVQRPPMTLAVHCAMQAGIDSLSPISASRDYSGGPLIDMLSPLSDTSNASGNISTISSEGALHPSQLVYLVGFLLRSLADICCEFDCRIVVFATHDVIEKLPIEMFRDCPTTLRSTVCLSRTHRSISDIVSRMFSAVVGQVFDDDDLQDAIERIVSAPTGTQAINLRALWNQLITHRVSRVDKAAIEGSIFYELMTKAYASSSAGFSQKVYYSDFILLFDLFNAFRASSKRLCVTRLGLTTFELF
jgi:hypothetical protein